jgi:hypothetical protein
VYTDSIANFATIMRQTAGDKRPKNLALPGESCPGPAIHEGRGENFLLKDYPKGFSSYIIKQCKEPAWLRQAYG